MRLRRRIVQRRGFPPNAHGRRNIDGTYFAIWQCQNGHGCVGDPDSPQRERCMTCLMGGPLYGREPMPAVWTLCTPREARDFLFDLEGFGMYSGVGFVLSDEVRAS